MPTLDNKRIAKNTLMLYVRMLLTMGVSLYTSRVVLAALGVNDYGIYNVVGGFVAMFSLISASLTTGISRFITYELGRGDIEQLKKVFATSCFAQYAISGILILLAETAGLWFLNTRMNIAPERMVAANWVFQCSLLTLVVNLISVPYNAAIVAHERMSAFAYISIIEAVLKLLTAFTITLIPDFKLQVYAILLMITALSVRVLYTIYCKRHFEESRVRAQYHKQLFKEIAAFSGWNFIGASSAILRDQGVNVLLNIFCGTAVNAARGIAVQVSASLSSFSGNFVVALNPQITKLYAQKEYGAMFPLLFRGSKFAVFIMYFLALPLILNAQKVLSLWLVDVPDYAVIFTQMAIIYVLIETVSLPLVTLMLSTGKIRNYQLIVGGCQMLNFPLAYLLLKLGYTPECVYVVSMGCGLLCLVTRLYMLRIMTGLSIRLFCKSVLVPISIIISVSALIGVYSNSLLPESFFGLACSFAFNMSMVGLLVLTIGCTSNERNGILTKCKQLMGKVHL